MTVVGEAVRSRVLSPFGAEIALDLSSPLDEAQVLCLRELLRRHDLLVFHGQSLSQARQIEIARIFGDVNLCPENVGLLSTYLQPGLNATTKYCFHSDYAFAPSPLAALSLHALDVVDGASGTRFVSTSRAYERASDALKARLASTRAEMVATPPGANGEAARNLGPESFLIRETRDILWRDALSGRTCILASEMQTSRIVDLSSDESDALLDDIFELLYAPDNQYEHRWKNGDFIIWNNMTLQHGRGDLTKVGRRDLQRVCIGEGLTTQYPDLHKAYS